MSVVTARVYEDKIVMAADSIIAYGWTKTSPVVENDGKKTRNFSKLIEVNGMLIGGVGSAESIQLMQIFATTHKPKSSNEKDMLDFVVEFNKWKNDMPASSIDSADAEFLIAVDGELFCIGGLYIEHVMNYSAIGAGMDYALAALYLGHSPAEAAKTACELNCFVSEPVFELTQERKKK